jgi:hypothetical protein
VVRVTVRLCVVTDFDTGAVALVSLVTGGVSVVVGAASTVGGGLWVVTGAGSVG